MISPTAPHPQLERNKAILRKYLPEPTVPLIAEWIYHFDFKLKIKKSRSSKYGDYRQPLAGTNHLITINHDLNPYAFLLTLVHEIAHLLTFNRHGNRVKPHGEEWKQSFKELMRPVMRYDVFPADVRQAIIAYMQDPGASSCSDPQLQRVLKQHDAKDGVILLEMLPLHTVFTWNENRRFVKLHKRRTRYLCREIDTNREYLFSGLAEVTPESAT